MPVAFIPRTACQALHLAGGIAAALARRNSLGDHWPMTTAAQLAANRANALRSTGPRTPEGQSVSAMNARSHGLRSSAAGALLPGESKKAWEQLHCDLRQDLQPHGEVEELLVDRVAAAVWKLRRAAQFEAGVLEAEEVAAIGAGRAVWRDANKGQALGLVVRYSRSSEASLYQALHELERRQARRLGHGGGVPIPVAVDVTVNE